MKVIPTGPRASLPKFHKTALQDCTGKVVKKTPHLYKN